MERGERVRRCEGTPVRWPRVLLPAVLLGAVVTACGLTSCSSSFPESLVEARAPGLLRDHAALLRARRLAEEGDLDAALEALEAGQSSDPPSELRAELYREQSRIYVRRGNLVAAYRAIDRGRGASQDPRRRAEMTYDLARAFDRVSLPGDALVLYREVWTDWPLAKVALPAYARSLVIEESTGAEPSRTETLLAVADDLSAGARCEAALELYEQALARSGLEPVLRRRGEYARADCLFARKRYAEAANAYARIVKEEPKDRTVRIALARSHARNGNRTLAVKQLDSVARRADPLARVRAKYLAAVLVGSPESPGAQKRLPSTPVKVSVFWTLRSMPQLLVLLR